MKEHDIDGLRTAARAMSDSGSEGLTERAARPEILYRAIDALADEFDLDDDLNAVGYDRLAETVLAVVWPEIYAALDRVKERNRGAASTPWALFGAVEAEIRKLSGNTGG